MNPCATIAFKSNAANIHSLCDTNVCMLCAQIDVKNKVRYNDMAGVLQRRSYSLSCWIHYVITSINFIGSSFLCLWTLST